MLSRLSFAVLLLAVASRARGGGGRRPCLCSALPPAGLRVNCSSAGLAELPRPPSGATELHAGGNRLTSVTPGLFDGLAALERVSLSGNRFHCDCGIQYLRSWLLKNGAIVEEEPTCASPSAVARKAISELGDDHFSDCGPASCADVPFNLLAGATLGLLVLLLLWSVKLAKMSAVNVYTVERRSGVGADPPRPKPRRRHTVITEVSPL